MNGWINVTNSDAFIQDIKSHFNGLMRMKKM